MKESLYLDCYGQTDIPIFNSVWEQTKEFRKNTLDGINDSREAILDKIDGTKTDLETNCDTNKDIIVNTSNINTNNIIKTITQKSDDNTITINTNVTNSKQEVLTSLDEAKTSINNNINNSTERIVNVSNGNRDLLQSNLSQLIIGKSAEIIADALLHETNVTTNVNEKYNQSETNAEARKNDIINNSDINKNSIILNDNTNRDTIINAGKTNKESIINTNNANRDSIINNDNNNKNSMLSTIRSWLNI